MTAAPPAAHIGFDDSDIPSSFSDNDDDDEDFQLAEVVATNPSATSAVAEQPVNR